MKILLANDDGFRAEGIRHLRHALAVVGDLTIVAPDRNRSGASNSLTLDVPLRVHKAEDDVLVTTASHEVLTAAAPKHVHEIESLRADALA